MKTHDDLDEFQFRNGKKKLRIDLKQDIERWTEIQATVKIEGKEVPVKGKAKIFYKGQPYKCWECKEIHTQKCPERIAREEEEKEVEKFRLSKVKSVLVGDSNLRYTNEKAFFTRTECATGAKIGHTANAIKYLDTDKTNVVIVHTGQNNVDDKQDMGEWEKQVKEQIGKLKTQLERFDKAIIVGVPPAPVCEQTEKAANQRVRINKLLSELGRSNLNISFVQIEQEDDRETNWEDYRHMKPKFLTYVLGKVSEKFQTATGESFHMNTEWTTDRKYGQVNATYRLGCEDCTEMGHAKDTCPRNQKKEDKKKRKGRVSNSELPEAKKQISS